MIKMLISILVSTNLFCLAFAQDTCENNCGAGTLQEYWDGEVDCVCSLECADMVLLAVIFTMNVLKTLPI